MCPSNFHTRKFVFKIIAEFLTVSGSRRVVTSSLAANIYSYSGVFFFQKVINLVQVQFRFCTVLFTGGYREYEFWTVYNSKNLPVRPLTCPDFDYFLFFLFSVRFFVFQIVNISSVIFVWFGPRAARSRSIRSSREIGFFFSAAFIAFFSDSSTKPNGNFGEREFGEVY